MNPFDPMPTIKAILGLPIYQEVVDARLLAALDDFAAPQCESLDHRTGAAAHFGAAGFLLIVPCHCFDGYRCAPFIKWLLTGEIYCGRCDSRFEPSDLTVIPIAGNQ